MTDWSRRLDQPSSAPEFLRCFEMDVAVPHLRNQVFRRHRANPILEVRMRAFGHRGTDQMSFGHYQRLSRH
jgi:hypothetical protein